MRGRNAVEAYPEPECKSCVTDWPPLAARGYRPTTGVGSLPALFLALFLAAWTVPGASAPANDNFNNRITLVLSNVVPSVLSSRVVTGTNSFASKQNGEPNHAQNVGGKSVWWTWTAPLSGDARVTTDGSDFDTLLAVYKGTKVNGLSLVAENDDHIVLVTSRVRFRATAGTAYQMAVDGFAGPDLVAESGKITLLLTFIGDPIPRPTNDDFASSALLSGTMASVTNSNLNATGEAGEPLHAGETGDTSIWWRWTPPESGSYVLSTVGSSIDTLLAVYRGDALTNLVAEAFNDDIDPVNAVLVSRLILNAVGGSTYRIAVDGYDGAAGTVVLSLGLASPRLSSPAWLEDGRFRFTVNSFPGATNDIQASTNLTSWATVATVVATNGSVVVTDPRAVGLERRHYRAILRQ